MDRGLGKWEAGKRQAPCVYLLAEWDVVGLGARGIFADGKGRHGRVCACAQSKKSKKGRDRGTEGQEQAPAASRFQFELRGRRGPRTRCLSGCSLRLCSTSDNHAIYRQGVLHRPAG